MPVCGRRGAFLRGRSEIEKAVVHAGTDRRHGTPDLIRHPEILYAAGDGRQKGMRAGQLKARNACRHDFGGDDFKCGGTGRDTFPVNDGRRCAGRIGDCVRSLKTDYQIRQ